MCTIKGNRSEKRCSQENPQGKHYSSSDPLQSLIMEIILFVKDKHLKTVDSFQFSFQIFENVSACKDWIINS